MIKTGRQIRAARAFLGWTRADLARASGLHRNSIAYWESADEIPTGLYHEPVACRLIRQALSAVGVKLTITPHCSVGMCRTTNNATSTRGGARPRHGVLQISSNTAARGHNSRQQPAPSQSAPAACGARTRVGRPCARKALMNGRCVNHGGKSTGPKTEAGRKRISRAQKTRWRKWRSEFSDAK